MTGYAALLRGVNVGGHNLVAMSELRGIGESLGYERVATFLQSGNVVFRAGQQPAREGERVAGEGDWAAGERVARGFEEAIEARLGLRISVLVRSCAQLAATLAANPMPEAVAEPSRFLLVFLSGSIEPARLANLTAADFPDVELRPGDRLLYAWYREGMGHSKLTTAILERRLGLVATARNWTTVSRLAELTSGN